MQLSKDAVVDFIENASVAKLDPQQPLAEKSVYFWFDPEDPAKYLIAIPCAYVASVKRVVIGYAVYTHERELTKATQRVNAKNAKALMLEQKVAENYVGLVMPVRVMGASTFVDNSEALDLRGWLTSGDWELTQQLMAEAAKRCPTPVDPFDL